jgi:hypothetical protein
MVGVPGHRDTRRYVCRDVLGQGDPRPCACHRVDADAVESAVCSEISGVLSDPQRLLAIANTALEAARAKGTSRKVN